MEDRNRTWWSRAVFYQVYPRSFADSDGDGVGDLDGVAAKLDYLELLGVDAIWLNPVTVSPMADHGYDVADPRDVDELFGGLDALDRMIAAAHQRGIKVTMDLVPNHTSSQHPWFQAALAAGPGTAQRERYIFRDGRGAAGAKPPNNWVSVFGGPAWTRVTEPDGTPGQWYLHLFDARAAGPELGQPRGFRRFREDAAVLAGPRGRRFPPGCRARDGQAARAARHEEPRPQDAAHRQRGSAVQPRRRACDPPRHPLGARRLPARGRDRRGVGVRQRTVRQVPATR